LDRGAGTAVFAGTPPPAPRTRLFNWAVHISNSRRRSWSTPRLVGPCLIKDFTYNPGFGATPPALSFEFGKSPVAVDEDDVLLTVPRPYTRLSELLDADNIITANAGEGYLFDTIPSTHTPYSWPVNLIITDPEIFVVMATINNSALAFDLTGWVTIVEDIDPVALASFL
jgi:hypothetical protein